MKKIQAILLTGLMVLTMTLSTSTPASAQTATSTRLSANKIQPPKRVPPQCDASSERLCIQAPPINILQLAGVLLTVVDLVR